MKRAKFKTLLAVLLICYIDVAICGFQSPGSASETVNQLGDWTMLRSHSIGVATDGSYFAEVVLLGKGNGNMCWALWQSPVGTYSCPDSVAAIRGNVVERPLN